MYSGTYPWDTGGGAANMSTGPLGMCTSSALEPGMPGSRDFRTRILVSRRSSGDPCRLRFRLVVSSGEETMVCGLLLPSEGGWLCDRRGRLP